MSSGKIYIGTFIIILCNIYSSILCIHNMASIHESHISIYDIKCIHKHSNICIVTAAAAGNALKFVIRIYNY